MSKRPVKVYICKRQAKKVWLFVPVSACSLFISRKQTSKLKLLAGVCVRLDQQRVFWETGHLHYFALATTSHKGSCYGRQNTLQADLLRRCRFLWDHGNLQCPAWRELFIIWCYYLGIFVCHKGYFRGWFRSLFDLIKICYKQKKHITVMCLDVFFVLFRLPSSIHSKSKESNQA